MRRLISRTFVIAWLAFGSLVAFGQTSIATDPVGFTKVSCLANSDTFVSVPFTRPIEFVGAIQSIQTSTITVTGSPGWTPNQFVYAAETQPKHYYAFIGPGTSNPKQGHLYFVSGNGTNTVTIDTIQDDLTGIVANT